MPGVGTPSPAMQTARATPKAATADRPAAAAMHLTQGVLSLVEETPEFLKLRSGDALATVALPTAARKASLWERRRAAKVDLPRELPRILGGQPTSGREREETRRTVSDEFEVLNTIGHGSTCTVARAKRRSDGLYVALKMVRCEEPALLETTTKEYELLKHLEHPNIVKVLDFLTTPTHAVLALELFPGKHLGKTVCEVPQGHLQEGQAQRLFVPLLQALCYLHKRGIAHRDVKPENVLVTSSLQDLRLVDFNTAGSASSGFLTPTGTRLYAAPELSHGGSPSEQGDIWGAGICLHLMLSGLLPKRLLSQGLTLEVVLRGEQWGPMSEACKQVVLGCLAVEESDRPMASALLATGWAHVQQC